MTPSDYPTILIAAGLAMMAIGPAYALWRLRSQRKGLGPGERTVTETLGRLARP